jgi:alkaline phosphatase
MKKIFISLLVIVLIAAKVNAQDFIADSLKLVIATAKSDSAKASAMMDLAAHAYNNLQNIDTTIQIVKSTLEFAREKGLAKKEIETLSILAWLKMTICLIKI